MLSEGVITLSVSCRPPCPPRLRSLSSSKKRLSLRLFCLRRDRRRRASRRSSAPLAFFSRPSVLLLKQRWDQRQEMNPKNHVSLLRKPTFDYSSKLNTTNSLFQRHFLTLGFYTVFIHSTSLLHLTCPDWMLSPSGYSACGCLGRCQCRLRRCHLHTC